MSSGTEQEDRFRRVYAVNFEPLLAYAMRRVEQPEDAGDVVAETFLVAWRRSRDMPPEAEVRLWLYGVARRVLANHHRGGVRRERLGERLRQPFGTAAALQPLTCRNGPSPSKLVRWRPRRSSFSTSRRRTAARYVHQLGDKWALFGAFASAWLAVGIWVHLGGEPSHLLFALAAACTSLRPRLSTSSASGRSAHATVSDVEAERGAATGPPPGTP